MRHLRTGVLAFLITSVLIFFPAATRYSTADPLPKDLPAWFKALDKDHDGQVSLNEWLNAGHTHDDFRQFDLNGDGFITPDEVLRILKQGQRLQFVKGQVNYRGTIEEAPNERYQGKKSFKIFSIRLEAGKTYQIDELSQAYYAYLYLEDPHGNIVDENDSGGVGLISRIIHRPTQTGIYRIIATSQGGFRTGPFSLSITVLHDLLKGLPPWFKELDTDEDNQVSLQEWLAGGKNPDDFAHYDLNGDGFITAEEALRVVQKSQRLEFDNGQVNHRGAIDEPTDVPYQGKKLFKIFTIKFEEGKTYQIEHVSQVFSACLYLEDPHGTIVGKHNSSGWGRSSRLIHHAAETGIYRIIATSRDGNKTGLFSLSISVLNDSEKGLPAWFKDLDKDHDGQVSLQEWLAGGNTRDDFRLYDLNGDGFITAEEVLWRVKQSQRLEFDNGQIDYYGTIGEATDDRYQNKMTFKIFTIKLQQGQTYQIEEVSQVFFAFLYLEDPSGAIVESHNSGGRGLTARIIHQAAESGIYRIIATSQDGVKTGDFSLTVRVVHDLTGSPEQGLPAWFKDLDTDHDGQVSVQEWLAGGYEQGDFRIFDLNGDGFITADEMLRLLKRARRLTLDNGQLNYRGSIEEAGDDRYQNKMTFKIFTIKLQQGQIYQIEEVSQVFYAFLYLEDPNGEIVARHNSGGRGQTARIIYQAAETGVYRIIATSQDGVKTGDFSLSVRVVHDLSGSGRQEQGLPPWFKELDTDQDGQISLAKWLKAGRRRAEFRVYDLNGDGFITAEEVLRYMKSRSTAKKKGNTKPQ